VSPYPWSISDFCRDLSTTSCTRQQSLLGHLVLTKFNYSRVPSPTFIHCSVRRTISKYRATIAGSMRSSDRSSSPPRLVSQPLTSAPNVSAPCPGFLATSRQRPCSTPGVGHHAPIPWARWLLLLLVR
jgi:hypothetical protein